MPRSSMTIPHILACRSYQQGRLRHEASRGSPSQKHQSRFFDPARKTRKDKNKNKNKRTRVAHRPTMQASPQGCARHGSWDSQPIGTRRRLACPSGEKQAPPEIGESANARAASERAITSRERVTSRPRSTAHRTNIVAR